jgi:hypothetical protein
VHLMFRVAFGAIALGMPVAACGGEGQDGNSPEDGGAASGTGGADGGSGGLTGGTAGTSGGDGGTGGTVGGSGGTDGGTGGQWPECGSESDCRLISNCCTCMVAPAATPEPEGCDVLCETDLCTALVFGRDDVACERGFCGVVRADGTCNAENVTCASSPPSCPADYLPSVVDGCWGPCVIQFSCLSTG